MELSQRIKTPRPSKAEVAELTALKSDFDRVAHRLFPHFRSLQEHGEEVVRICLFSRDLGGSIQVTRSDANDKYFGAFQHAHAEAPLDVFLFFQWLNGGNHCLVALPSCWEDLGLKEPRDFAVFNGELLAEFHRDDKLYIQVESMRRNWESSWKFCNLRRFNQAVREAGTGALDLLQPERFVDLVFFDKRRLEERASMVVNRLRDVFQDRILSDPGGNSLAEANLRELSAIEVRLPSLSRSALHDLVREGAELSGFGDARGIVARIKEIMKRN